VRVRRGAVQAHDSDYVSVYDHDHDHVYVHVQGRVRVHVVNVNVNVNVNANVVVVVDRGAYALRYIVGVGKPRPGFANR